MTEDRRAATRYPASFPGELDTGESRTSIAITRDVSASGLLMLSRRQVALGSTVKLKVLVHDDELHLSGTVVRREPVDPEQSSLWRFTVAVAVDPSPAFDKLMAGLEAAAGSPPSAT